MSEPREFRDPVFNFISLTGIEAEIVNTSVFQRLRGIRQLAFANLVYPGALHTRFEHSLGVCHIADRMATTLDISREDKDLLRLSALLHDIGHGPFSHISEDILEIYSDRATSQNTYKIHEAITADIIRNNEELNRHLRRTDPEKIIKILASGYGDPILHSIVSGPIDADKQDYLLRDSYFCGVKYGVFDLSQLHRELKSKEDEINDKHLRIGKDGIHALEQFVLAKYYITNQVYRHRVRLITDQMLIRAINRGIDHDHIEELQKLYTYKPDNSEYLNEYLSWDDSKFMVVLTDNHFKGKECHTLLTCLKNRNLLKRIYQKPIKELSETCRDSLFGISQPMNKEMRSELESHLWEPIRSVVSQNEGVTCFSDNPAFLIVNAYSIKSAREMSRNDEASITVDRGFKAPSTFEEESTLFNSINEKLNQAFIEIYAPIMYETTNARAKFHQAMDNVITKEIENFFQGAKNADT